MNEPVIGRTIREGEILYSLPNDIGVRLLKERYEELSDQLTQPDNLKTLSIQKISINVRIK